VKRLYSVHWITATLLAGAPGDQGWVDALEEARRTLEERLDWVHTTVRTGVTSDTAPEILDTLASGGWRLIVVAAPALREQVESAAANQTATTYLLLGDRETEAVSARDGALESVRYLAGRAAGARAMTDGRPIVGCVARRGSARERTFLDAAAMGVLGTCPGCRLLVRWIPADGGAGEDADALRALFEAGADVAFAATGGETALAAVPTERWVVARALAGPCAAAPDRCLTATFWQWVWEIDSAVKRVNDGSWQGGQIVLGPDHGVVGLLGFMDQEAPPEGIPPDTIADLRERFDRMKKGNAPELPDGPVTGLEEVGGDLQGARFR